MNPRRRPCRALGANLSASSALWLRPPPSVARCFDAVDRGRTASLSRARTTGRSIVRSSKFWYLMVELYTRSAVITRRMLCLVRSCSRSCHRIVHVVRPALGYRLGRTLKWGLVERCALAGKRETGTSISSCRASGLGLQDTGSHIKQALHKPHLYYTSHPLLPRGACLSLFQFDQLSDGSDPVCL